MLIGIYKITSPTNRIYIGQSRNIKKRLSNYKQNWFLESGRQPRLRNSLKKYGADAHKFEIIEICNVNELDIKERFYQEKYDVLSKSGLNCVLISDENKPHIRSSETREKISKSNKGKVHSELTKKKISEALKGRVQSNEVKKKRGDSLKGYKHSIDFCKSISERMKGCLNHQSKIVLNTETGIFYDSITECAKSLNIKPKALSAMLNGWAKKKVNVEFV